MLKPKWLGTVDSVLRRLFHERPSVTQVTVAHIRWHPQHAMYGREVPYNPQSEARACRVLLLAIAEPIQRGRTRCKGSFALPLGVQRRRPSFVPENTTTRQWHNRRSGD